MQVLLGLIIGLVMAAWMWTQDMSLPWVEKAKSKELVMLELIAERQRMCCRDSWVVDSEKGDR